MFVARRVIIFSMASHHGLSDYHHTNKNPKINHSAQQKYVLFSIPDTPPCPDTIIERFKDWDLMGSGLTIMQRWWSSPQSCPHVTGTNPVRSSISLELANGQVLQTRLRRRTMQKHRRAKALTIFYWLMFGLSCHNCKVSRNSKLTQINRITKRDVVSGK